MTTALRPSQDKKWLASVRTDLDSDPKLWAVQTPGRDMSKLQVIAAYLDTLLTDLGAEPEKCRVCGQELPR